MNTKDGIIPDYRRNNQIGLLKRVSALVIIKDCPKVHLFHFLLFGNDILHRFLRNSSGNLRLAQLRGRKRSYLVPD
jgi:hypothetical protein